MPVRTAIASLARLAIYAAALLVLATARLPSPATDSSIAAVRVARPSEPAVNLAWRLALAGIVIAGVVADLKRRRHVWH
jgi:hypothetical protein